MGKLWEKHLVIVEKILIRDSDDDFPDFEFFRFDDITYCVYMIKNTQIMIMAFWAF